MSKKKKIVSVINLSPCISSTVSLMVLTLLFLILEMALFIKFNMKFLVLKKNVIHHVSKTCLNKET